MEVSQVEKTAQLARLSLTDAEKVKFSQQISAVLESFEAIAKVETKGVEPLVTPTDIALVFREDDVVAWKNQELALANAPEKSGHLFRVPPVV